MKAILLSGVPQEDKIIFVSEDATSLFLYGDRVLRFSDSGERTSRPDIPVVEVWVGEVVTDVA